jgi:UDP:flavonoid glycosyltransferase YjiC (YdhE family)
VRRLKVARVIERDKYTPARVMRTLKSMLANPKLAQQAERVAHRLESENGVRSACNALEELYARTKRAG